MTAILIIFFLTIKHFVFDFLYQPPRMWQNKGTYGHIGGIEHSFYHAFATYIIITVMGFGIVTATGVAIFEFIVHYHMDWFKMNYNKRKGWGANTHPQFWVLLGVDQLVHSLTYIAIAAYIIS
jgi:hypothetical protein